jgi:hypothetical protein
MSTALPSMTTAQDWHTHTHDKDFAFVAADHPFI